VVVDAVSGVRVLLGGRIIAGFEAAVEEKSPSKAAFYTGALGVLLFTDAVDGYLARKAQIDGSIRGRLVDSLTDVALRGQIAKSKIMEVGDNPGARRARIGGEALVASAVAPDVVDSLTHLGQKMLNSEQLSDEDLPEGFGYVSTMLGKIKSASDGMRVTSDMIRMSFAKSMPHSLPEKVDIFLRRFSLWTDIGSTALAYLDGANRWRNRLAKQKRVELVIETGDDDV
jgi:hypothetical protein